MKKVLLALALWSSPIVGFFLLVYPNKLAKIAGVGYMAVSSVACISAIEKLPNEGSSKLQKLLESSDKNYQDLLFEYGNLEATVNAISSAKNNEIVALNENLKACKSELATVSAALNYYQSQEETIKNQLDQLEADRRQLDIDAEKFSLTREKLDIERASLQNELDRQFLQQKYTLDKSSDKIAEMRQQIIDLTSLNQQLNHQLLILKAESSKPKNRLACLIFELFHAKQVRVEYVASQAVAGIESHVFKPLTTNFKDALDAIISELPGLSDDVKNVPAYKLSEGKITLIFDNRQAIERVKFGTDRWLSELSVSENNLLILGARGTGKSELMINFLHELYALYPADFSVNFCQPKPDDFSHLILSNGEMLKPKYVGFEDCLEAVLGLNQQVLAKNKSKEIAFKQSGKIPDFAPEFWVIDEFQQLIFQAENFGYKAADVSLAIKNAVSLGRSLKVYVICLGQIPNVSQFPKWNKADFYQFSQIYLGDAIKVGCDYVSATASESSQLKSEFQTISEAAIKWFGLVRNGSKNYWCKLPVPVSTGAKIQAPIAHPLDAVKSSDSNRFSDYAPCTKTQAPGLKADILCPSCGSINIKKKGSRDGRQRYQCSDCGKNFSA
jgi:predicted RNA-binding Zn-ribbon protein involved in translation (DUF1610 family)/uncharacterized protein YggL (DUF469 family)